MPLLDLYGRPFTQDSEEDVGVPVTRQDRWVNHMTGIGSRGDKSIASRFDPVWRVLDEELVNLWNGSDIAAKIVELTPKEMFRCGWEASAEGVSASEVKDFRDWLTEKFDFDETMLEGFRWGRLFGGGLLIMGIDDGREMWEPLNEDNIRSFDYLNWVDRRYAYAQSQYATLNSPSYGKVEIYLISNAIAGAGWNTYGAKVKPVPPEELKKSGANISLVHESRCIRFDGNPADIVTRQRLAGWNWSVLQVVYEAMRQFEHAFDSAGYLLSDASQGVFKLHGLLKAITSGQKQAIADRVMMMEQTRSVMRGVALDAGNSEGKGAEDFTRIATPFGGVADMLDRMMLRLCAATGYPATELFGMSPAGLNATGESDTRKWYDQIKSLQSSKLSPRQKRIMRLAARAKNSPLKGKDAKWEIEYNPLLSPTDLEISQARLANAQRDDIYLEQGVVTPPEVGVALGDVYPHLDVKAREEMLKSPTFDPHDVAEQAQGPTDEGEPQSPSSPTPTIGKQKPASAGQKPKASSKPVSGTPLIGTDKHVKKPAKVKDSLTEDRNGVAVKVYNQLEEDYPKEAIDWVPEFAWSMKDVPLSQIDFSNSKSWQATKEPAAVAFHTIKIHEGSKKPIILVKTPSAKKYIVVDGHHRALAYKHLGEDAKAFVTNVDEKEGPWDAMHDSQNGGSQQITKGSKTDGGELGMRTWLEQHGFSTEE